MTLPVRPEPNYLSVPKRPSLEARLDGEAVSGVDRVEAAVTSVRDNLLNQIPGVGVLTGLVKAVEDFDAKVRQKKIESLLEGYLALVDQNAEQVDQLKKFLTDPWGATLFTKLMRVIEVNPPDPDMLRQFAVALRQMVNSDFTALFTEHRFALGVIESLSPQAMAVLADHRGWPAFSTGGGLSVSDGIVMGNSWIGRMSVAYGAARAMGEADTRRLSFVLQELQRVDLAVPRVSDKSTHQLYLAVTEKGKFVLPYLTAAP